MASASCDPPVASGTSHLSSRNLYPIASKALTAAMRWRSMVLMLPPAGLSCRSPIARCACAPDPTCIHCAQTSSSDRFDRCATGVRRLAQLGGSFTPQVQLPPNAPVSADEGLDCGWRLLSGGRRRALPCRLARGLCILESFGFDALQFRNACPCICRTAPVGMSAQVGRV